MSKLNKDYLKTFLVSLVAAVVVFGAVEWYKKPVDLNALALNAAELVDVPEAIRGEKGLTGSAGKDGDKGDKGDKGDTAVTAGPAGTDGKDGKDGLNGVPTIWVSYSFGDEAASGSYRFTFDNQNGSSINPKLEDATDPDFEYSFGVIGAFTKKSFELKLAPGDYSFTVGSPTVEREEIDYFNL